jgi:hypothetical protein
MCLFQALPLTSLAFDDEMNALAHELAGRLAERRVSRIAVADFSMSHGEGTAIGTVLADELSVALAAVEKSPLVIDRSQLAQVVGAQPSGADRGLTFEALRRVEGVEAVVTGTVAFLEDVLRVTATALDVESAAILASAMTQIPRDDIDKLLGSSGKRTGMWRSLGKALGSAVEDSLAEALDGTSEEQDKAPSQNVHEHELTFELDGCEGSGTSLICSVTVTNGAADRELFVYGSSAWGSSTIVDGGGNQYGAREVHLANRVGSEWATGLLVQGVPTGLLLRFDPVSVEIVRIARLAIHVSIKEGSQDSYLDVILRDIDVSRQ